MFFALSLAFILFSLGFSSANTLIGGKIYNSDFTEVISGADVNVQCGSQTLDTESTGDGAYAVIFDSEDCPLGSEAHVTSSKGSLTDKASSDIYESEDDGNLIGVINLNLHSITTTTTSGGSTSKEKKGTWFQCGNTVCDSGETYLTCPEDCPENLTIETETLEQQKENITGDTGGSTGIQKEEATAGGSQTPITGAVTGVGSFWSKNSVPIILLGLVLLLIIVIAIINIIGNITKKDKGGNPQVNENPFYP